MKRVILLLSICFTLCASSAFAVAIDFTKEKSRTREGSLTPAVVAKWNNETRNILKGYGIGLNVVSPGYPDVASFNRGLELMICSPELGQLTLDFSNFSSSGITLSALKYTMGYGKLTLNFYDQLTPVVIDVPFVGDTLDLVQATASIVDWSKGGLMSMTYWVPGDPSTMINYLMLIESIDFTATSSPAATPIPATALLFVPALGGLIAARRRIAQA